MESKISVNMAIRAGSGPLPLFETVGLERTKEKWVN
jgi:hypothetical protein